MFIFDTPGDGGIFDGGDLYGSHTNDPSYLDPNQDSLIAPMPGWGDAPSTGWGEAQPSEVSE